MYQIKCDDYILYDPRDDELVVLNPKCKLEVNTVGEGSFTILHNHPFYGVLKKLKSIFEIREDGTPIFRGRMTADSRDLHNQFFVDMEGILAVTNDSIIPPFKFPEDFPDAANATNVVEYFLGWALDQHNAQVTGEWQKLKLGNVTVTDPNNYITRSSEKYLHTWDILKTKLFESSLGGYLCARYESDGTYVDYLNKFPLTNTQRIRLGENLLDFNNSSDASETYSAILPIGKDGLTLESLADGNLTDDLVKKGKFIYSKSAVADYGWICVPVTESTWDDVTEASNLKNNGMDYLTGTGMKLATTITVKAVDLHFTDDQIQSFRIYRNILVDSSVHGLSDAEYPLTKLDIDLLNPQNTDITIGDSFRTLVDINADRDNNVDVLIQGTKNELKDVADNIDSSTEQIHQTMLEQRTELVNTAEQIILSALENYVETSNFEEFQRTLTNELEILADRTSMNFTETTEQITNVDGDLQAIIEKLEKHFDFSVDGLVIRAGENAMNLILDNDLIRFMKNGQQFGWWDGVDFHTGNIVVTVNERAQFGSFAFVPRSNGSLSFLKVSGENAEQRTLIAISAKYDGGTVTAGTSLTSLTDLTVTAHYSDNSMEVVDNYTLSGAINAGTNTIRVSYGDKTTSFTVVGEAIAERTLQSISASYSGGSVPVGTLVESLSDITVTAHYSDGSTSVVNGASRSGTINAGENTITITYQGMSTTVIVVGVASASDDIVLSDKADCVVYAWLNNTTAGAYVQYASDVRAVDGNVELVNPMRHTVYMQYSGVANDYTVLLDKYVKSFNGDIYYIDPDSTYTHSTNVSAYVKESIAYHSAHVVGVAG